jgi:hypothetical protein
MAALQVLQAELVEPVEMVFPVAVEVMPLAQVHLLKLEALAVQG